jgi:hypothetical protein
MILVAVKCPIDAEWHIYNDLHTNWMGCAGCLILKMGMSPLILAMDMSKRVQKSVFNHRTGETLNSADCVMAT